MAPPIKKTKAAGIARRNIERVLTFFDAILFHRKRALYRTNMAINGAFSRVWNAYIADKLKPINHIKIFNLILLPISNATDSGNMILDASDARYEP
ncbi:hypothetical protein GCM10008949_02840 [Deinococcus humi]|nr:hypothetical protein GCM10008949_02840 [Deinococcus humi]